MKDFVMLTNGNIVLVTSRNVSHGVYHGINLASPELRHKNIPIGKVKQGHEVSIEDCNTMIGSNRNASHAINNLTEEPSIPFERRVQKIVDKLAECYA